MMFLRECEERLGDMESTLLKLREDPRNMGVIDHLFRAASTIKSAAGMAEFTIAEEFTHIVENVLEQVRSRSIDLSPELIDSLLACKDHMQQLIKLAARNDGTAPPEDVLETDRALRMSLSGFLKTDASAGCDDVPDARSYITTTPNELSGAPSGPLVRYRVRIQFLEDTFRHGFDPISFLQYLYKIGTIEEIALATDLIPPLEDLRPESCFLETLITLLTDAGEVGIREVFEFMELDCRLTIEAEQAAGSGEQPQPGATPKTSPHSPKVLKKAAQVRVDANQLDQLVDLVGELIISGAYIGQLAANNGDQQLVESAYNLARQVGDLRESTIELRMVPVGGVFSRFRRIVHDLGMELGKKVRLVIEGAETRLDRTLIDSLTDPLMHAVRNAIDHGLEDVAQRVAAGKSAEGTILLNAYREAGEVIIEVRDDGAGLSREKILSRALQRGLIQREQTLADAEVYALLFEPGFSTAETITSISGRGVGLDSVRRAIEDLRGKIEIESPDVGGTILRFRLPLTLAMIEGLLVRVGTTFCVIPLDMVHECVEFTRAMIQNEERQLINLHDEVFPFVDLAKVFSISSHENRRSVVMVNYANKRAGLVVDELRGQVQSVIKPPGLILTGIRAISGNSILGDGSVAMILDVAALLDDVKSQELTRDLRASF